MLSDKNKGKRIEAFTTLPTLERRLVALKAICCQYTQRNSEKSFIDIVIKTGVADESGKPLTANKYQDCLSRLKQLGLSQSKSELSVAKELHHDCLVLLSKPEMDWVCRVVDTIYGSKIPDFADLYNQRTHFYENSIQIRARLMRALYANEADYFISHPHNIPYCTKLLVYLEDILAEAPVSMEWLKSREESIQFFICVTLLAHYYCEASYNARSKAILAFFCEHSFDQVNHDFLHYYSSIIHLARGDIDRSSAHCMRIQDKKSGFSLVVQASIAFLTAQFELAVTLYRKAIPALRKQYESRSYYLDNIQGLLHNFCMAYVGQGLLQVEPNIEQYYKYAENRMAMPMLITYELLPLFRIIEQGNHKEVNRLLIKFREKSHDKVPPPPMAIVLHHLLGYMTNKQYVHQHQNDIYASLQECISKSHLLAAHILYELLGITEQHQKEATVFFQQSAIKLKLLDLIYVKEAWEYSFQALEGLLLDESNVITASKAKRLLWLLNPDKQTVDVIEQSLTKNGQWSAGRAVSFKKLKYYHQYEQFNYLTTDDKRVIDCLIHSYDAWHGDYYKFDPYRTFLALVGNRNIAHHQNREVSIELIHGEPELYIEENKKSYHLSLSHWLVEAGVIIEPESLSRYRVIDFSQSFANIGKVLTKKGLSIPTDAKEKVLRVIQHAKRDIKIHIDIKDIDIPEIAGDPTPCIQFLPIKEGLKATLWVRSASQGTYCKIAQGKEKLMTLVMENGNEKRARIIRDFSLEKSNLLMLFKHCPSLVLHEIEPGEYDIDNPEDVLEVLSELQEYASSHPLVIEWPQGQTFKIRQRLVAGNLSLKIKSDSNWFEYEGKMQLNDGEVLLMQELLESMETQSYGRFVRLGNGEFIELTSQLKKQLTLLHVISDGNRINPLGSQVLSDIAEAAENTLFDEGWQTHLQKIKAMKNHAPKLPSTLQASLRDYQMEGFQYLSRLTNWGIGACLADDMGLGKTIQTIVLLLERAKNGAALVVAPTSVSFNWEEELNKFAPTLRVYDLRTDNRAALIESAGQFDVIICSYGLLHHNDELLTAKQWETIVLDEAQAIKNPQTQRWKTVMRLRGKNRIALSGTPIENHLGELWSIFSFINPGILGSIKSFQSKYSSPIETGQSPEKVQALKALVSPYILRRIKSEVLKELPPKTEQIIHIEPTAEEAAFYEALRRRAEERMNEFMEENNRIAVLAEITKLRQACCDSSLVDASLTIENSKLNTFIETVKNIIDNGHKALVFSQYVAFLQIVKKRIEKENISYQYLDGSTAPAQRKKSVELFQSGEGDLFLLSLKAGGSGLNLTAADYVIHLDPWWNPAVEDQASDRAYRIGQERPVTIYRFIMQNTIEEKIIQLHQKKRNLASELLSGQGVSGKLSNEDLINLILPAAYVKEIKHQTA